MYNTNILYIINLKYYKRTLLLRVKNYIYNFNIRKKKIFYKS